MRRRRRDRPLQRGRVPWVFFLRFLPCHQAPDQVKQEEELRSDCDERGNTDENMDRLKLCEVGYRVVIK